MAIKIYFDASHNAEVPTFVVANRNGNKLGQIDNVTDIDTKDYMNDCPEVSFTVHKYANGKLCHYWDYIRDFKLVWCKEWDIWFEMEVELNESDETIKNVSLNRLGESELSQINLYDIEINTEDDIKRDDYKEPTILYNSANPKASLLHRIFEKAPHYSIRHVDSTIAKIQRTFSFNNKSIKDALDDIAEEINCIVVYESNSDSNGKIQRTISVYDLESNCLDCGHRGEYTDICPKCGSKNISEGYGDDTTICISTDDLGDEISLEVDVNNVKNCFKLEAGDDLLTATIANCNPNGTGYLWYISDEIKEDMSDELVKKLDAYDKDYKYYQDKYQTALDTSILTKYNNLVTKYQKYDESIEKVVSPIIGYSNVMKAYYNTIDFLLYLTSGLMPDASMSETSAKEQATHITRANISPVAVTNASYISLATADSTILGMTKVVVDSRYQVKVKQSSLSGKVWTGNFTVTNYSDEEDTYDSATITVDINDDYETFIEQKIKKSIKSNVKNTSDSYSGDITSLFELELADFKIEIKEYGLNSLVSFNDACQACIDIMIEQGVADSKTWADKNPNLYESLYTPYYQKLQALQAEVKVRENEILIISDSENKTGLQEHIKKIRNTIQSNLEFEKYLGTTLWLEFCSYRREDTYDNSNYISDGLNNAELFDKALEFIEVAQKEIFKSATLQHKITTKMKNLLVIKEFEPLMKYFSCGNWLRIKIDGELYKLRLLQYSINYDNLQDISVTFSDVIKISDGISDTKDVLEQAASMSSSYDTVKKQASQGANSSDKLNDWIGKGLDMTTMKIVNSAENQNIMWDSHGFWCREYDEITDSYSDNQLKIINKGLYLTDDNWKTSRAGIGNFIYYDPRDKVYKEGYGIIADTICSNLILSEEVGIFNVDSSVEIGKDGIVITTDTDAKTQNVFTVRKLTTDDKGNTSYASQLYIDDKGNVVLGNGAKIMWDGIDEPFSQEYGSIASEVSKISNNVSGNTDALNKLFGVLGYNGTTITGTYIYSPHILGGDISIGDVAGVHAIIDKTGKLSCSGADITGKITASSGMIGDLSLNNGELSKTNGNYTVTYRGVQSSLTNGVFFITDKTNGTKYPFRVNGDGSFSATKANISGGVIGGWTITATDIYNVNDGVGAGIGKCGTSYAFWAGTTYENRNNAPFRVGHDGDVRITNGYIKIGNGYINSDGDFTIGSMQSRGSSNVYFNNSLFVNYGVEIFSNNLNNTPYIDFHNGEKIGDSNTDYTTRLVSPSASTLMVHGAGGSSATFVSGTIQCNNLVQGSDKQLKNTIVDLDKTDSEKFIMSLRPVSYKYNSDNKFIHHGFIYQDVIEKIGNNDWAICSKISQNIDGSYKEFGGLSLLELIADMVSVIQKQNYRIELLEKKG